MTDAPMTDTPALPANTVLDASVFARLQASIDRDADFREQLRGVTRELDRVARSISFILLGAHGGPNALAAEASGLPPLFDAQRTYLAQLASIVSGQPYYKYASMFSSQMQAACFGVVFARWLGVGGARGELLTLEQVGETLGVPTTSTSSSATDDDHFHLPLEDYLHALISLINELSRLAVNAATHADYTLPPKIDAFIKQLFAGFQVLNLKNDSLRRRFDGIKYDVKKVEEVVYDLRLRGLVGDGIPADAVTPAAATAPAPAQPYLKIKLLTPEARAPTRGSALAAGYDMYASESCVVGCGGGRTLVKTGVAMAVPADCYGRVAPRSGLAVKSGIATGAGVIDADYRGEVRILLFNHHPSQDFQINTGDRIAQLVLERIYTPDLHVVQDLDESVRGAGGFGSTGTN
ncbi:Translin-1 [Savitreella phatthalungensis]